MGHTAHLVPPLINRNATDASPEEGRARKIIQNLEYITMEAQDNLLHAKISQLAQANKSRILKFPFTIGGRVWLSTLNRWHEYKKSGERRVAKFMPRFDGPYMIVDVNKENSTVTLDLPNSPNVFPTFHTSVVVPYVENNPALFPNREFARPPCITTEDGKEEFFIHDIIDERRCGHGSHYLVRWVGYGAKEDCWLLGLEIKDTEALDIWLAKTRVGKDLF